jgi:hypothetical protein
MAATALARLPIMSERTFHPNGALFPGKQDKSPHLSGEKCAPSRLDRCYCLGAGTNVT